MTRHSHPTPPRVAPWLHSQGLAMPRALWLTLVIWSRSSGNFQRVKSASALSESRFFPMASVRAHRADTWAPEAENPAELAGTLGPQNRELLNGHGLSCYLYGNLQQQKTDRVELPGSSVTENSPVPSLGSNYNISLCWMITEWWPPPVQAVASPLLVSPVFPVPPRHAHSWRLETRSCEELPQA